MNRIVRVSAGQAYMLEVTFAAGMSGNIDLSARLFGPVFERWVIQSCFLNGDHHRFDKDAAGHKMRSDVLPDPFQAVFPGEFRSSLAC